MPGNNIGGKTLLATCMTLMALLFLPYVRAMDTILRGACPEAAAGTGDNVKVCPLGCFTEPAGVVFQRMRSFGYCGCLFLALTALVGVQDEKSQIRVLPATLWRSGSGDATTQILQSELTMA